MTIIIGCRASDLALAYANKVKTALESIDSTLWIVIKTITTKGDEVQDKPIYEIGGKGVFCSSIEQELLNDTITIAVHSLKDMPGQETKGLCLGAVLPRNSFQDVIVGKIFNGCTIGTSSPRRKAQLQDLYKNLNVKIKPIRGNVDTRLKKLDNGDYDAIVLAEAGIKALEIDRDYFSIPIIPAVGQGIIAVQVKEDNKKVKLLLEKINDKETFSHAVIERALLKGIGGDCHTKLGAIATGNNPITLKAVYYD